MSSNPSESIFDLGNAVIIDPAHVRVERLAPKAAGEPAIYQKAFKATAGRDYRSWTDYENQFFHLLALKKLNHVAQLAMTRKSMVGGVAQTTHLETFDAGPDMQHWCRVQPRYADGTVALHPFQHVAQYLQVVRACLVALKEIHQHDIVHGDIKEDNICLFYQPYPYDPESGGTVQIDFKQLKLIDFAWSLSRDVALEHPLPISGVNSVAYQAPALKAALEEDRKAGKPIAVKKLDYRIDLYGLGHLAETLAEIGLIPPRGAAGLAAFDGARHLGTRLKALSKGKKPGALPHDGLIAEIDELLKGLPGPEAYRFRVSGAGGNGGLGADAARVPTTPMTPLAEVGDETPIETLPQPEAIKRVVPIDVSLPVKSSKKSALALGGVALAVAGLVWKLSPPGQDNGPVIAPIVTPVVTPIVTPTPVPPVQKKEFHDAYAGGVGPTMVAIPAGSFMMGSPASENGYHVSQGPQHQVNIASAFALSKTTVTFDEWDACVKGGGCGGYAPADRGWGRGTRPVINVSWDDAQHYVAWLSKQTGKSYRLPTEAEWEYAARAGTKTAYYWGDEISKNHANCNGCGSQWDGKQTAPVGSFAPNQFGLHDMSGNVWQWTQDCWHGDYSGKPPIDGSGWDVSNCQLNRRVLRGGSWFINPVFLRAALRINFAATYRFIGVGLRIARTLP